MKTTANGVSQNVLPDEFPAEAGADQKLLFLLNFAILAPSSHNTQPWLFQLQGHEVDLVADLRRALPVTDPDQRELIMSCGAALHHLRLAARYFGYGSSIEYFPEPENPNLLARFTLGDPCEVHTDEILLFHALSKRHTNRLPFLPDPLPTPLLEALAQAAAREGAALRVFVEEEPRFQIADLVGEADRSQWRDRLFRRELAAWLTPNRSLRRDGIPGYAQASETSSPKPKRLSSARSTSARARPRGTGTSRSTPRSLRFWGPRGIPGWNGCRPARRSPRCCCGRGSRMSGPRF